MIIVCINCNKKFELNSDLIPENGRLLQCGSCNHEWFFKKDVLKKVNKEPNNNDNDPEVSLFNDDKVEETKVVSENKAAQNHIKSNKKKNELVNINTKSNNSINFLKLILVFIISFISIIIIIDTFKTPISSIVPNIEFILYSLYESIKDIFLFLKDLI